MKPREHFFMPDTQVRPGVPIEHIGGAGNYVVAHQPDVIVIAGDFWDMPSLSSYDRGTKRAEGARYLEDIEAGDIAMDSFLAPIKQYNRSHRKKYKPRMVFLMGNHEERILRHVNAEPILDGVIGYHSFRLEERGFESYEFLQPVCIDGVTYAHYFYNPLTGRPYGGRAPSKLANIGFSFTQGHVQGKDLAEKYLANGRTLRGLVAGSFYQHEEEYKGPQANDHWRGCIYKHEVRDGNYDLMELSLRYLLEKWT